MLTLRLRKFSVKVVAICTLTLMLLSCKTLHNITFVNSCDDTVVYYLYRIDHDFNIPGDINYAAGELEFGAEGMVDYPTGKYWVMWLNKENNETFIMDAFELEKDTVVYCTRWRK